jgi:hypothetical protein
VDGGGDPASKGVYPPIVWKFLLDRIVLLTISNRCTAKFLRASPSSQLLCQKQTFAPTPIVIVVDELKSSRSVSLQGSSDPAHGLDPPSNPA